MPHLLSAGQRPVPARPDRAIALGAALLIVDLPGLPKEFDLVAMVEANPWAVVAALRPADPTLPTVWRRHPALRSLVEIDGPEEEWDSALRHELTSVGPPEPTEVVAYITRVRPDPTFARALLAELRGFSRPGRSARHSAFKRHGPLTATAWKGLYAITKALSLPGRLHLGDAAARLGMDRRTLGKHFREVLELDWRDARHGFGWKWTVERALRLHGYVADDSTLPLAFHASYPVALSV